MTLTRPAGSSAWIVVANAQKHDGSSGTLTVSILSSDGTVLNSASTSAAYGVAQTSYSFAAEGGEIPEFPYQLGIATASAGLVIASYLLVRRRPLPSSDVRNLACPQPNIIKTAGHSLRTGLSVISDPLSYKSCHH